MNLTIYDISQKAGVSIATVSRVLNGSEKVSEKTRQKVLSIMDEYHYKPNAFARGLGLNSMQTIGILCADSSDIYLSKAVYYLESKLQANGYHCLLCCTGYSGEGRQASMQLLLNRKVDAVILAGSSFVSNQAEENAYLFEAASHIPVMILNAELQHPGIYCTLCDDAHSIYTAAKTMLTSGRNKLLYLNNSHSYSALRKLDGWEKAMKESAHTTSAVLYCPVAHDDMEEMCVFLESNASLLLSYNGIICADDALAVAVVKFARKHHLNIPEDLAVIGYNNSLLATCCEPELTSVDNHLAQLCDQLVQNLFAVMSKENVPPVSVYYGELVKRNSFTDF